MRAIDRHEDAICLVLDLVENGMPRAWALTHVAAQNDGLSIGRLDHLVKMWCAVAGTSEGESRDVKSLTSALFPSLSESERQELGRRF